MSSRQQPSSRSSCVRQASAEASGSSTVSATRTPARFTAVTRFCVAEAGSGHDVHVDFEALADHADGVANIVLRVEQKFLREHVQHLAVFGQGDAARGIHGAANVFALHVARASAPSVMPPRLFTPRTWLPATPVTADSTGTPASVSASSTARRIEADRESRLTIWPLRQPFDSAAPMAANFTLRRLPVRRSGRTFSCCRHPAPPRTDLSSSMRCSFTLQNTAANALSRVLGQPPLLRCAAALSAPLRPLHVARPPACPGSPPPAVEAQVHRLDAPGGRAPLAAYSRCSVSILRFEIGIAKVHQDRARSSRPSIGVPAGSAAESVPRCKPVSVARKSCASERSTSLTCSTAPARADSNLLHESGEELHALFAIVARHVRSRSR